MIAPDRAISITAVYSAAPDGIEELTVGVTSPSAGAEDRRMEARHAEAWYRGAVRDAVG